MPHRYSKHLPFLIYLSDFVLLNFAINVSAYFYLGNHFWLTSNHFHFSFISNTSWLLVSYLSKTSIVHRPLVLSEHINKILVALGYHIALVFASLYILHVFDVSRAILILHLPVFLSFILVQRSLVFFSLDYIRKKGFNLRRVLILGDEDISARLKRAFKNHPEYGYTVIGFISSEEIKDHSEKSIKRLASIKRADEIYICYKELNNSFVARLLEEFKTSKVQVKVISDLIVDLGAPELISYDNLPVINLNTRYHGGLKVRLLKRSFDLVFACTAMVCGSPLFLLLMVVTKLSSRGPVFYKQQRLGLYGQPFYIYKFRSMYVDAEKLGPQLSSDNDPRITPWGRIIRKTRLDELPQFYNVLKGDMSIVGPRPERQYFIEKLVESAPQYNKLLSVRPGITSIGQVRYGYAENIDQMLDRMRYDLLYLNNQKFRVDLAIILETVRVMIQKKGK